MRNITGIIALLCAVLVGLVSIQPVLAGNSPGVKSYNFKIIADYPHASDDADNESSGSDDGCSVPEPASGSDSLQPPVIMDGSFRMMLCQSDEQRDGDDNSGEGDDVGNPDPSNDSGETDPDANVPGWNDVYSFPRGGKHVRTHCV